MRKGFVKLVFVLGVMAGGAFGTLVPASAEAVDICPDICTNDDCSCFRECWGSTRTRCECSPVTICQ